jgi:hypothetical protein
MGEELTGSQTLAGTTSQGRKAKEVLNHADRRADA